MSGTGKPWEDPTSDAYVEWVTEESQRLNGHRFPADREPPGTAEPPDPDEGDPSAGDPGDMFRKRYPRLDWAELWKLEDGDEWLLEPIIPVRRLVALYSPPKVGKSLLLLEIAVAIARGSEILGYTPDKPRKVLYVDHENDPRGDIKTRLKAMGYGPDDLENLIYLSYPSMPKLDTATGGFDLVQTALAYECELVVIDTVSRTVSGEENSNDTWLAWYRNTGEHLKRNGIACIRLDHTGKDEEKGMRGGSSKYGDVDAVWKMSRVVEGTFRLECEDKRLMIHETTLTLRREVSPVLRHVVETGGAVAAKERVIAQIIGALDHGGKPVGIAAELVKEYIHDLDPPIRARKTLILEANRRRRERSAQEQELYE